MLTPLFASALIVAGLTASIAGAQTVPSAPPAPAPSASAHGGRHGRSLLMTADANHDGTITRTEMLAAADARAAKTSANPASTDAGSGHKPRTPEAMRARAAAMFDRIDTNHDGKLDPTEIAARREMMRGARGRRNGGTSEPVAPGAGE